MGTIIVSVRSGPRDGATVRKLDEFPELLEALRDGNLPIVILDLAINPVTTGSGTNLKMLDYMAAGVPVLSTPHGARGLGLLDAGLLETAEQAARSGVQVEIRDYAAA